MCLVPSFCLSFFTMLLDIQLKELAFLLIYTPSHV